MSGMSRQLALRSAERPSRASTEIASGVCRDGSEGMGSAGVAQPFAMELNSDGRSAFGGESIMRRLIYRPASNLPTQFQGALRHLRENRKFRRPGAPRPATASQDRAPYRPASRHSRLP